MTTMIPDWLKNEDIIYNRMQYLKEEINDLRKNYQMYIETGTMERFHNTYSLERYLNIPAGIETDDNLKPISIIIGNWERQYYIPIVLEMYNAQDYPKDLVEIIIVDDDSFDKAEVLNIVKEQAALYSNLNIRFIQNYINKTQSGSGRINIGVRHASHDIVVTGDSDAMPLGKNFLRGICYYHNRFKNVLCVPIGINTGAQIANIETLNHPEIPGVNVSDRLDHQYLPSFNKELFSKIHGYDEQHVGWGGNEANIMERYTLSGGKYVINTLIYGALLVNFSRRLPPDRTMAQPATYWQEGIIVNNENWGISEKMEEINLYQ